MVSESSEPTYLVRAILVNSKLIFFRNYFHHCKVDLPPGALGLADLCVKGCGGDAGKASAGRCI